MELFAADGHDAGGCERVTGKSGMRPVRTATGLRVRAELDAGEYPTGVTVTKEQMDALALVPDAFHGEWNYKLLPRPS